MSETQTAGGGSWPALETLDVALTVVGVALNAALGQSLVLRTDPFLACFPGGGASYGAHLDGGGQVSGCKLTTIVYANSGWVAEAGGELHMLDERAREWRSVQPIAGRVVIFHSESILHRVQPSYARRFALTAWWYVDDRRGECSRTGQMRLVRSRFEPGDPRRIKLWNPPAGCEAAAEELLTKMTLLTTGRVSMPCRR